MAEILQGEAFKEAQAKYRDAESRIRQVQVKMESNIRERRKAELTLKELEGVSPSANIFKAIGRTFIKEDVTSTVNELQEKQKSCEKELAASAKAKEVFDKQYSSAQLTLNELVAEAKKLMEANA